MPLPFILGAAALGALGLYGAGKTVGAISDNMDASDKNETANDIITSATKTAENSRENCKQHLETLGKEKITLLTEAVAPFVKEFRKIKKVNFAEAPGIEELSNIVIDENYLNKLEKMSDLADTVASGSVSAATAGAVSAFGAYSAVGLIGSASTGTAISSLGGAAATNATLAWLGGGALAAGGFGVAGGAAILGGIVAAPALAIFGAILGSKASENLENARANLAKAKEYRSQMKAVCASCDNISKVSDVFFKSMSELYHPFYRETEKIKVYMQNFGYIYTCYPVNVQRDIAESVSLLKLAASLLNTAILDQAGVLTKESIHLAEKIASNSDKA